jgi:hypothetical protein
VTHTPIAPGARIVVRNEEWLVRRVDPSSDGGRLLTCDGGMPMRHALPHFPLSFGDYMRYIEHVSSRVRE